MYSPRELVELAASEERTAQSRGPLALAHILNG